MTNSHKARNVTWHRAAITSALISLAVGCADAPTAVNHAPSPLLVASGSRSVAMMPAQIVHGSKPSSEELAAAKTLARALALSMRDSSVRRETKEAIAASSAREHKLELASYLEGRGGRLLATAARSGMTTADVQAAVAKMRQLEFYMPVHAHSSKWAGEGALIVAVWLGGDAAPIGFSTNGQEVALDLHSPPATPTLVAVPVETDLTAQAISNRQGLANPCYSTGSETLAELGNKCAASAAAAAAARGVPLTRASLASDPNAVGLYMTFLRLLDAQEFWFQGDPEVEVHITGRRSPSPAQAVDYQCIGEHASDPYGYQPGVRSFSYVFDMNSNFWNGNVLLLSPAQVDTLQANLPDGFNVSVWEDDDTPCEIRQKTSSTFADAISLTSSIAHGINAVRVHNYDLLGGIVTTLTGLVQGGDDYAGLMVAKDSTSFAGTNPGTTHMIYIGTTLNGRATLVFKTTSYTPPPPAAAASMEIAPGSDTVGLSNARQFSVAAYDASGAPIANPPISWQSSNSSVAQVDGTGFVRAVGGGSATITASSNGVSVGGSIVVTTPPLSVTIHGPTTVKRPGAVCTYTATTSGGSGSIAYQWYIDGVADPSGETTSSDAISIRASHTIKVVARTSTGTEASASTFVSLVTSAPTCVQ